MKYVLGITQRCNLACTYCYVDKRTARMSLPTAKKIVDFAFTNTPLDDRVDIGFFGGEPLLEFDLVKAITGMIREHPQFDSKRVELSIVTNGTIFSDEIASFVAGHDILFGISCDGPPVVQDAFRRFPDGRTTSDLVEKTIKRARETIPTVLVNAVFHPRTFRHLPQVVEYFAALGFKQINLNPDFSASWSVQDIQALPEVYGQVARRYMEYYVQREPRFINLIDNKIAVILRQGYALSERCSMGRGEFAFSPEGNIYPCERLVGDGTNNRHCIGNVNDGLHFERLACNLVPDQEINTECLSCALREYCMNWCGCSNYMATGYYNRVNHFMCMSEKAAIQAAFNVFKTLEQQLGPTFVEHLSGFPSSNSRMV
jgi:uncharacterized protein